MTYIVKKHTEKNIHVFKKQYLRSHIHLDENVRHLNVLQYYL